MLKRILSAGLLILPGLFGNVQAQDYCGSLSNADCTLLNRSHEVMAQVNSAAFRLDLDFEVQDNRTLETISMRLVTNGTFVYAPASTNISPSIEDVFHNLNADISAIFEFEDSAAPSIPAGSANLVTFDVRMVEGIAYLQLDKTTGLTNPFGRNWYGMHLAQLITELMAAGELSELELMPDRNDMNSQANSDHLERLEDVEHSGQQMAVFEERFNFGELLADPDVYDEVLNGFYETLRQQFGSEYSNAQLRLTAQNYLRILHDMNMKMTRLIGLDDGYLHQYRFELEFRPRIGARNLTTAPDPFGLTLALDIQMRMALSLELAQFNDAPLTTAPPNAIIIPLDDLLPFLLPGSPL